MFGLMEIALFRKIYALYDLLFLRGVCSSIFIRGLLSHMTAHSNQNADKNV